MKYFPILFPLAVLGVFLLGFIQPAPEEDLPAVQTQHEDFDVNDQVIDYSHLSDGTGYNPPYPRDKDGNLKPQGLEGLVVEEEKVEYVLYKEDKDDGSPCGWKKGPLPEGTWNWGGVILFDEKGKPATKGGGFYFADFVGDHVMVGFGEDRKRVNAHEVAYYNNCLSVLTQEDIERLNE